MAEVTHIGPSLLCHVIFTFPTVLCSGLKSPQFHFVSILCCFFVNSPAFTAEQFICSYWRCFHTWTVVKVKRMRFSKTSFFRWGEEPQLRKTGDDILIVAKFIWNTDCFCGMPLSLFFLNVIIGTLHQYLSSIYKLYIFIIFVQSAVHVWKLCVSKLHLFVFTQCKCVCVV